MEIKANHGNGRRQRRTVIDTTGKAAKTPLSEGKPIAYKFDAHVPSLKGTEGTKQTDTCMHKDNYKTGLKKPPLLKCKKLLSYLSHKAQYFIIYMLRSLTCI